MDRHKIFHDIQSRVDEQLSKLGPTIDGYVSDHMVDREMKKRGDAIVQGMDKLSQLEDQLEKLEKNPDFRTYGKDMKPTGEATYSEKKMGEIKKLTEQIGKLQNAMVKAYTDGDLRELNQLLQSDKGKDKGADGAGDSSPAT